MFDDAHAATAPMSQPRARIYALEPDGAGAYLIDLDADPVQIDPKPSRHASVKGLFGVIVSLDAMSPRFKIGEIAWIHPHLPVRPGDDVLFIEKARGAVRAIIGELDAHRGPLWRARLHNPPEPFDVRTDQYRALRILPRE